MRRSSIFKIRNPSDVPFYCNPLHLFFVQWALMLTSFLLRISFASYPDFSVALLLFAIASISFLAGYLTIGWSYAARRYQPVGTSNYYQVDLRRLRCFHLVCVVMIVVIVIMNWKRFGLPPFFGALGEDTLSYQEYGALRQPMFAVLMAVFISAPLEPSAWRRWGLLFFAPACTLLYGARGYLLIMLYQALAVFSLRTQKSRLKIYGIALATLAVAVFAADVIGNGRNSLGVTALLGYLQIKQRYHNWPPAYLWVVSYVATPFSNMCWIVRMYHYQHPSYAFFYSALPGEWPTRSLEMRADLGSEKIIDGVHTYMAKYYLDFWYFGVIGINYVWGLIAGALRAGNRLTRNYLLSGVLLGCMAFMFFSDYLTMLIILLEIAVVVAFQRYIILPVKPAAAS